MYHLYTGEGKGKTTAALGLGLRALGANKKVHMMQFIKGLAYSEISIIDKLEGFSYELLGRDCFLEKKPDQLDIARAQQGLAKAKDYLRNRSFDLLILDEIHMALYFGLVEVGQLLELIGLAGETELVTTGRYAPLELINRADLVTEMREIKHYYQGGVEARKGIEY